jgi:hypothetical protein
VTLQLALERVELAVRLEPAPVLSDEALETSTLVGAGFGLEAFERLLEARPTKPACLFVVGATGARQATRRVEFAFF